MRRAISAIVLSVVLFLSLATATFAAVRVRGYYRSSGTYVQPYYRTSPDSYRSNNYSSRGNYNPYTGRYGTKSYWR